MEYYAPIKRMGWIDHLMYLLIVTVSPKEQNSSISGFGLIEK